MSDDNYSVHYLRGLRSDPGRLAEIREGVRRSQRVILYFHGGLSTPKYVERDLGPRLEKHLFQRRWFQSTAIIFVQYEAGLQGLADEDSDLGRGIEEAFKAYVPEPLKVRLENWAERQQVRTDRSETALKHLEKLRSASALRRDGAVVAAYAADYYKEFNEAEAIALAEALLEEDLEVASMDEAFASNAPKGLGGTRSLVGKLALALALVRTLRRLAIGTHHGAWATLVEEILRIPVGATGIIGAFAQRHWDKVQRHAQELWKSDADGYALLKLLDEEHVRRGASDALSVHLVSHSAGSIPICEAVQALPQIRSAGSAFQFGKLVLLAPAVKMKLFHDTIMKSASDGLYREIRIFALDDAHEAGDALVPVLYPRSLLYFVSGVAERSGAGDMTVLGMHRHFDRRDPYVDTRFEQKHKDVLGPLREIRDFLGSNQRMVLSPNNSVDPGREADSRSHEDSKLSDQTPRLAASVVFLLTGIRPQESDIRNP